jgi:hypothetical protein
MMYEGVRLTAASQAEVDDFDGKDTFGLCRISWPCVYGIM